MAAYRRPTVGRSCGKPFSRHGRGDCLTAPIRSRGRAMEEVVKPHPGRGPGEAEAHRPCATYERKELS